MHRHLATHGLATQRLTLGEQFVTDGDFRLGHTAVYLGLEEVVDGGTMHSLPLAKR